MGSSRTNVGFAASVLLGLAVFAAIVLPGSDLSWQRFAMAAAAFLVVAPGSARLLTRLRSK